MPTAKSIHHKKLLPKTPWRSRLAHNHFLCSGTPQMRCQGCRSWGQHMPNCLSPQSLLWFEASRMHPPSIPEKLHSHKKKCGKIPKTDCSLEANSCFFNCRTTKFKSPCSNRKRHQETISWFCLKIAYPQPTPMVDHQFPPWHGYHWGYAVAVASAVARISGSASLGTPPPWPVHPGEHLPCLTAMKFFVFRTCPGQQISRHTPFYHGFKKQFIYIYIYIQLFIYSFI